MLDAQDAARNTRTGIRAFATGAAIGAVVTLLCAPARGRDTRAYLTRTARNGKERAQDAARAGRDAFVRQRRWFNDAVRKGRPAAPIDNRTGSGSAELPGRADL
jgi:hypothetical protein